MIIVDTVSSMAMTAHSFLVILSSDHYNTCKVKRIRRELTGVPPSDT